MAGDGVELLAVELWTSEPKGSYLCHQHTQPMLVKRVAQGEYMEFLELCCFWDAKTAEHLFYFVL